LQKSHIIVSGDVTPVLVGHAAESLRLSVDVAVKRLNCRVPRSLPSSLEVTVRQPLRVIADVTRRCRVGDTNVDNIAASAPITSAVSSVDVSTVYLARWVLV